MAFVYFIQDESGPIKIGVSFGDPWSRYRSIQTGNPRDVHPLGMVEFDQHALDLEGDLHARFASSRVRGEWFDPTPELLTYIAENCEEFLPPSYRPRRLRAAA